MRGAECGEGDGGGGEREKRAFAFRKEFPSVIIFTTLKVIVKKSNDGQTVEGKNAFREN